MKAFRFVVSSTTWYMPLRSMESKAYDGITEKND
jgi:hypothetical protein